MSRAFVKEDEDKSEAMELPVDTTPAPVTPEGHAALTAHLEALQGQPESADLAKQLARRLPYLVVTQPAGGGERVMFGTRVELEGEDGVRVAYRIVGPDETDLHEHGISVASPIAHALMGRALGDEVSIERPKGTWTAEIVAVDPEPAPKVVKRRSRKASG